MAGKNQVYRIVKPDGDSTFVISTPAIIGQMKATEQIIDFIHFREATEDDESQLLNFSQVMD